MVDSIEDGDVRRLEQYIDIDQGDTEAQIKEKLGNRFDDFTRKQVNAFGDLMAERREPTAAPGGDAQVTAKDIDDALNERKTRSGQLFGDSAKRAVLIRADDGSYIGSSDKVSTWIDQHGNLMGHNSDTGTRKKIVDKSDLS